MEAGEYPQPLQRSQQLLIDLVNGYTTGRLEVQNPLNGTVTGTWPSLPDWGVTGVFENIGSTAVTVQLVQTPSIVSGPRTNLGTAIAVNPSGRVTTTFTPTASFVEISCTSGGPSQLRLQLSSKLTWTLEGFTKYPIPDARYPQYTISGNYQPVSW